MTSTRAKIHYFVTLLRCYLWLWWVLSAQKYRFHDTRHVTWSWPMTFTHLLFMLLTHRKQQNHKKMILFNSTLTVSRCDGGG